MATAKRLPSGAWRTQVFAGTDASGRRQYRSFTAKTRKESEYAALQWQLHYREVAQDSSCQTLNEAFERYIADRDGILSPSTVRGYDIIRRNHFVSLRDTQLKKLTPVQIQTALNAEVKAGATPKTIRNVYGLLTAVLRAYHPSLARQLQDHPPTLPQRKKTEQTVLEPAEAAKLIKAIQGDPIEIPVLLALWLTLRQSEILGLTWGHVDFERHTLRVEQARVRNKEYELVVKQTKTTSSTRTLHLPEYIERRLQEAKPDDAMPEDFIIELSGKGLYSRLKTVLRREGLPDISMHALWHSCASLMTALDLPLFYIQRRGGWASDRVLRSTYTHILDSKRTEIDDRIDDYFGQLIETEE